MSRVPLETVKYGGQREPGTERKSILQGRFKEEWPETQEERLEKTG